MGIHMKTIFIIRKMNMIMGLKNVIMKKINLLLRKMLLKGKKIAIFNSKDDKIHIVAEFVLTKNQENNNIRAHAEERNKIIDYEDNNQNDEVNHDHDHELENFQQQEESIMN